MKFIAGNFLAIIILLLVIVLFADRCNKPSIIDKPIVTKDTIWIHHDSVVTSKPQLVKVISTPIEKIITNIQYKPDTNYQALLKQYNALLTLYFNKNIQKDTLKIDKLGSIYITDTISKNISIYRAYNYSFKYPFVKETIATTIHRTQLYIGGGVQGNPISLVNQFNTGILLKNKKDQIFGASIGLNINGQLQYGVQSYWKLNFKK